MTNWGKFENFNVKAINEELKDLDTGDYPEIPNGKYEVKIDSMELKPTKEKGYPMLSVQFTILRGDFEKYKIFMNNVILMGDQNDKYRVSSANKFLSSLDTSVAVSFEGVSAYEKLVDQIFDEVKREKLEYALILGENKKGFKTYTIDEVFEPKEL